MGKSEANMPYIQQDNLNNISYDEIQFNIDDQRLLDTLFTDTRGKSIFCLARYSTLEKIDWKVNV